MPIFVKVIQVHDSWRVKYIQIQSEDNLLVYLDGVLENASDFAVVGVDEELQTLVVTAVDNVLLKSVAQDLANGGTAALSGFLDARVAN